LKGRQDVDGVDRVGLRLALRKAQAEAGDIVLLFADESEALTHPYLARRRPGQAKKVTIMGALDHAASRLIVHTSRTKRSADFIALLKVLDGLYAPKPGVRMKPVIIVPGNTDAGALDRAIHAVTTLNIERNVDPLVKQRISA
jgi:hypothetical protein